MAVNKYRSVIAGVWLAMVLSACAVNPVTGDRELGLVSEREEVTMGEQNYAPMQQSEGGRYRTDPQIGEYVSEVGQRLAQVSDRDLPYEFVVLNNGVPNAWALPGGKIAINRGLLAELDSEAELAAVLGHEIVHSAARHGAQTMERGLLLQGAMVATAMAASDSEYAGYLLGGAQLGAQLINQRYGRDAEREADRYGTRYMARAGYDPAAAVDLQQTFVRLSEGQASGWLEGLFASHPASTERVENNRQLVQQLREEGYTDGEMGEDRYRQEVAFLHEHQEAYEAFAEARSLLQQGSRDQAMQELETALSMLPAEARFHGLRGDILRGSEQYDTAIESYDAAITRDDGYFEYYLGRGLARLEQGRDTAAQRDLQQSVDLLPTAQAMNALGSLALDDGDRGRAKQYFQNAASAPGELGEQAQRSFVRLDMSDNPGEYLSVQPYLDERRRVMLRVTNESPLAIQGGALQLRASLGSDSAQRRVGVPALEASQARDVDSGLTLPEGVEASEFSVDVGVTEIQPGEQ